MLTMAARMLRFRVVAFIATFVALCFGALIVLVCGGLLETAIRNNAPPQRLARAEILVTGDRSYVVPTSGDAETVVLPEQVPLAAGTAAAVRAVDGVGEVVEERTFDAAVLRDGRPVGPDDGEAQAHGWESAALAPYQLRTGAAPTRAGEVVLDTRLADAAGAKVGDEVRVSAHGTADTYRLTGIVRPQHGQGAIGSTLFFSAPDTARLAYPAGGVQTLAVDTTSGADVKEVRERIAEALNGQPVKVVTGDDRGAVEDPLVLSGRKQLIVLSAVFGGMATLVAIFIVSSTIGLAVQQRRREFALLRAIGATPGQLRRMLLGETLLLSLVSGAVAWLLGPPLGRLLFDALVDAGLAAEVLDFSLGWIPRGAATGAMLLTALLGGWIGARRAVTAKPTEALAEAATQQRWFNKTRLVLSVLFLSGTAALATLTIVLFDGTIAAVTAGPTVIVAVIGIALLTPGLTKTLVKALAVPLRRLTGVNGELALLNSTVRAVRMASVVTPVMLAVGYATGNIYLQTTMVDAAETAYVENLRADAVLTTASGGIDPALLERVRATDGVAGASLYTGSLGFIEKPQDSSQSEDGLPLQGVSADGVSATFAAEVTRGDLGRLTGTSIALTEDKADHLDLDIGDTVTVRLGDRSARELTVVAVYQGRTGYDMGLMPAATLAAHTSGGLPSQIMVRADEGTSEAQLAAALAPLADSVPGTMVVDRDTLVESHVESMEVMAWINYLLGGAIVGYAAISMINSLIMSTNSRRREFGLQRLNGATRAQVLRMATGEALLVTAVGVILGTVAAAMSLIPFSLSAADSWLPSGPLWIYPGTIGVVTAVTLGATLAPTWLALRVRPVVAATAGTD
ncbi:ABC transporter permease [Streptomyces sp. NPDC004542]|uniref:ABC transporter permease n=1 Tax=Streptomyces sp. NPDC004542 TaxID=3154281 RepID=UPI0033A450B9